MILKGIIKLVIIMAMISWSVGCKEIEEYTRDDLLKNIEKSSKSSFHTWELLGEDEQFYFIEINESPWDSKKFKVSKMIITIKSTQHIPQKIKFTDIEFIENK